MLLPEKVPVVSCDRHCWVLDFLPTRPCLQNLDVLDTLPYSVRKKAIPSKHTNKGFILNLHINPLKRTKCIILKRTCQSHKRQLPLQKFLLIGITL